MKEKFENVFKKLNLKDIVIEVSPITGGLLHKMYKVTTNKGVYAIKKLNPLVMQRRGSYDNYVRSEKISRYLIEGGINGISSLGNINNFIIKEEDDYYMAFPWLEGHILSSLNLNINHVKKIGHLLGRIHKIGNNYPKEKLASLKENINWRNYLGVNDFFDQNYKLITMLDNKAINSYNKLTKNVLISHLDMDLKNVMWDKDDNPYLIDFESANYVNPTFDLLDVSLYWSLAETDFNFSYFKEFISSYLEENNLNYDEVPLAIDSIYKNHLGWLAYNLDKLILNSKDKEALEEVNKAINSINNYFKIMPLISEYLNKKRVANN